MVIIASHSKDNLFQERYQSQLSAAKDRIKEFPILNDIFDNFDGYEKLKYKESMNKVFITIRPRLTGPDEAGYPQLLSSLEESLNTYAVHSWKREIYNEFVNRLTSYDYYRSEGAIVEILSAYDRGKRLGLDKLTLHPKLTNGKNGDILVTLGGKKIFIELTSLTKREATRNIEEAFHQLAKHLSYRCTPKNYAITVFVDTARLPRDDKGRIRGDASGSLLKLWSDRLSLHQLAGLTGYLDFRHDYSWIEDRKYLSELIDTDYELSLQSGLAEMVKNEPRAAEWASKIEMRSINFSPISAVLYSSDSTGDFVEVQSEEFYPSAAAFAQESSFHRQLADKIGYKIKSKQYEQGSPSIIMVKEDVWDRMFFDDDFEGTSKVRAVVEKELENAIWLSGVIIYDAKSDARYMFDLYLNDTSTLYSNSIYKLENDIFSIFSHNAKPTELPIDKIVTVVGGVVLIPFFGLVFFSMIFSAPVQPDYFLQVVTITTAGVTLLYGALLLIVLPLVEYRWRKKSQLV